MSSVCSAVASVAHEPGPPVLGTSVVIVGEPGAHDVGGGPPLELEPPVKSVKSDAVAGAYATHGAGAARLT